MMRLRMTILIQLVDIDPMFAGAYSNLGNAYKDMGRMEDAIKCFTTSIRLKPDFADAYANLAGAYRDSHRVDDAITCYRKALSSNCRIVVVGASDTGLSAGKPKTKKIIINIAI